MVNPFSKLNFTVIQLLVSFLVHCMGNDSPYHVLRTRYVPNCSQRNMHNLVLYKHLLYLNECVNYVEVYGHKHLFEVNCFETALFEI